MTGTLWVIAPLVCLAGGAFIVYLVARLLNAPNHALALICALAFVAAWVAVISSAAVVPREESPLRWGHPSSGGASLQGEPGALFVASVATGLGALVALYSGHYMAYDRRYETYYPLLLLLVAGLTGMVMADDLFSLYMFCELMSISAYALVAFRRHTDTAIEAGFKYLVMGSVGTTIALMGISFIYRASGELSLVRLIAVRATGESGWMRAGLACFVVGLSVKSAVVPLHTWLPDAHGRAPSSISAMLSGIVIQSALYTTIKVALSLGVTTRGAGTALIALSLLNMTLGNAMALVQTNTKRLLAYSSIAQTGYVMLGIGVGLRQHAPDAIQAGFFMLAAHATMKALAFLSKGVCHFYMQITSISQLRGVSRPLPLAAVTLSLSLAGLAGIPPLAGFAGKWTTLTRILEEADSLIVLALVLFVLNGLMALGYYLPTVGTLFSAPGPGAVEETDAAERTIHISPWMGLPLLILGGLVIAIGLQPGPWLLWTAHIGPYLLALGR